GRTGLNFAAGMSGGLAFVFDERGVLPQRLNGQMVSHERLADADEIESLRRLIAAHADATTSPHAQRLLAAWSESVKKFWKVVPNPPSPETPKAFFRYEPIAAPKPAARAPAVVSS
ncbi:MAG: hypothetical protein C0502_12140, partial [Opitutus sp.]|nr:hypothetical protein [Opitutus sp.]